MKSSALVINIILIATIGFQSCNQKQKMKSVMIKKRIMISTKLKVSLLKQKILFALSLNAFSFPGN